MAKVAFPPRCAVEIIYEHHLISQVYPASVPIEAFIDSTVELLNDELRRHGEAGLDHAGSYELQRANGVRLDVAKTLDELGIEDGTTLVLAPATDGEPFEPQYEALSTGLARVGKRIFAPVTAQVAVHSAIAILTMNAVLIAVLSIYVRSRNDTWIPAAVLAGAGVALTVWALSVRRWWPERPELFTGLALPVVPLLAMSAASAAPGRLGSAHIFIAALAAAVLVLAVCSLSRQHVMLTSATVTLCVLAGVVAGIRMFQPVPPQWLGMGVLVGLLILLTVAPNIALLAARIRPPHFGSITGRDLFQRIEGLPIDAVAPVEEEPSEEPKSDTTPSGVAIARAARRANGVLTGICIGAATALPAAVWATLMPGRPKSNAAAFLAILFIVIFISRARAFGDRRQAVALVFGACTAICAGVARYLVHADSASVATLLWAAGILISFGSAALIAALLVPATRFTPLVRVLAEWLELVAIVAALPLSAWIAGLFTWVRMR